MKLTSIKKKFQIHGDTPDTNAFKIFQVPIGNSKCLEIFNFHNDAPMLNYCQKSLNRCFFISLASSLAIIEKPKADTAISFHIEESLKSKMGNLIDFSNAILKNEK